MERSEGSNEARRTGRLAALVLACTLLLALGVAAAGPAAVRIDGQVGTLLPRTAQAGAVSVQVARTDLAPAAGGELSTARECTDARQCLVGSVVSAY